MTPHHIGCIVSNIDDAIAEHRGIHNGSVSEKIFVTSQNVWICFAELHPGFYIEFIQSAGEGSVVERMQKKGVTYYHIGYKTARITETIATLESNGFKLMNTFSSEAFNGKQCAFLFGSDGRLLELIEE